MSTLTVRMQREAERTHHTPAGLHTLHPTIARSSFDKSIKKYSMYNTRVRLFKLRLPAALSSVSPPNRALLPPSGQARLCPCPGFLFSRECFSSKTERDLYCALEVLRGAETGLFLFLSPNYLKRVKSGGDITVGRSRGAQNYYKVGWLFTLPPTPCLCWLPSLSCQCESPSTPPSLARSFSLLPRQSTEPSVSFPVLRGLRLSLRKEVDS